MSEKKEKFATFGQRLDTRFWCPPAGFCVSAFVLVKKDDKILLGRIAKPELWKKRWNLPLRPIPWSEKWVIPARHLKYGEHPDEAAKRIIEEILALSSYDLNFLEYQSHLAETGHWDLCFIYQAHTKQEIKTPEWYIELAFKDPKELNRNDFTRSHDDILNELHHRN
jgi:ADP-ribose pyrophosphatase YjhB (NUDIX family)